MSTKNPKCKAPSEVQIHYNDLQVNLAEMRCQIIFIFVVFNNFTVTCEVNWKYNFYNGCVVTEREKRIHVFKFWQSVTFTSHQYLWERDESIFSLPNYVLDKYLTLGWQTSLGEELQYSESKTMWNLSLFFTRNQDNS